MRTIFVLLVVVLLLPNTAGSQTAADSAAVVKTLDSWKQGWAQADVALAVQDYAEDVDWTNAFGDRFQGRDALKKGLEFIFGLDFVMAGDSGENEFADVTFLAPDVAVLRSKLVRTGQKTSTGEAMPDRHIHHLRVLQRREGKWQIVSHLISQAHKKRAVTRPPPSDTAAVAVPKIWDEEKLATWAIPVAGVNLSPNFYSEKEYYAAPVDNLRTYPVYHPDYEPDGYRDWLAAQGPKPLIEPNKLKTNADWLAAGRRVFDELDIPAFRSNDSRALEWTKDADAIKADEAAVTQDGILPLYRWVVGQDGAVKLSFANCGACHQRILPDGTLLRGAPSNILDQSAASNALVLAFYRFHPHRNDRTGPGAYVEWGVPWLRNDIHVPFKTMTDEELDAALDGPDSPAESFDRFNGSPYYENKMGDLIGVKYRKYLDATATHVNRGPEDIARYGALVDYADDGSYGPYRVMSDDERKLKYRFSDEALYALGIYIYSLEPIKSPHPFNELAERGQRVFESEGCSECHTPPLYTNNKLVAAPGFVPNYDDPVTKRLNISKRRVGTDPGLALHTRKGTGYYRIPTLRGLWYRGLYEHCGSVSSLEDWFDPKRLRDDYKPTGWAGPGTGTRAVPGHKFGHDLSDHDKRALIAFLKTL